MTNATTIRQALSAVALCTAAFTFFSTAHANLLINGSFEGEVNQYDLLGGGSTAIAGWTTTNEGVEWAQMGTVYPGALGVAKDGVSAIDLAWYVSNGTPGGGIMQSFATTPGQRYLLSFYGINSTYAGRDGTGIVDALINGNPLGSFSIVRPGATWTAGEWQLFSASFVATGATTALEFRNTQNAFHHFAIIDDVSVAPSVPEPASWAMMLAGFGAMGAAVRRRAKVRITYS